MAVTSGFFDSIDRDRLYKAKDFNSVFDVIYSEGIFQNTGNGFVVTAPTGSESNVIYVDTGMAWFDDSWIKNDSSLRLSLPAPDSVNPRYDVVVLDINTLDTSRSNTITYVSGTASTTPAVPTLTNVDNHKQHPIAYIYRAANTPVVTTANITDKRGQSTTTPPTPWSALKMAADCTFFADTITAFQNIGYTD